MKTTLFTTISLLFFLQSGFAQSLWPNQKKCAVCLTYDDALLSHIQYALPQLDRYGLKGTFYLTGSSDVLNQYLELWRKAAADGHELGNHTITHPCNGKSKGREWVTPEQELDDFSLNRFLGEVKVMNTLLKAIDGKDQRSFAYTCGDMVVDGEDLAPALAPYVLGARTTDEAYLAPGNIDVYQLPCFSCNDKTADQMIAVIEKARQTGSLVVFLFHGVGGDYLTTDAAEHEKLLQYLSQHTDELWVAPVVDVVSYLRTK